MFRFFRTIKAIKKLKKIEPDKQWLESLRLNFVRSASRSASKGGKRASQRFFQPRLAHAFVALVLIFGLVGGVFNSAQAALPSDTLYLVKLLSEQVQELFVIGNEKKIDFALKLAEKRLAEVEAEVGEGTVEIDDKDGQKTIIAGVIFSAQNNLEKAAMLFEKISLLENNNGDKNLKNLEKTYERLKKLSKRKRKLAERFAEKLPELVSALGAVSIASVNVEQAANKIVVTFNLEAAAHEIDENATSTAATSTLQGSLLQVLQAGAENAIARAEQKIAEVEVQLAGSGNGALKKLNDAKEELSEAKEKFDEEEFTDAIRKANDAFKKAVEAEIRFIGASDEHDLNHGTLQIIRLLTIGAGKSGKIPPGLLRAPGIAKKLQRAGVDIGDFDDIVDDGDNDDDGDQGGDEDTTAPVVSQVAVSGITNASATVTWLTDELTDSLVKYGTSTDYGLDVSDPGLVTDHSLVIGGLEPETIYHLQVSSEDAAGNAATSTDLTFTTMAETEQDVVSPAISDVQVSEIATSSAKITWLTDEPANSLVSFGPDSTYGQSASSSDFITNQSIVLTGLTPSSTVHFQVWSEDASGNVATSTDQTFTTLAEEPEPDTTAPAISSVSATSVSSTSAMITWSTDEPATSKVYYSPTSPVDVNSTSTLSQADVALAASHSLELTSLNTSSTYYFFVESTDASNNTATSSESSFVTLGG